MWDAMGELALSMLGSSGDGEMSRGTSLSIFF